MIKARAHRETQAASAPGYDDYVEQAPKSSHRVAVGFLLVVMACVAFVRSCIPFSSSQATEDKQTDGALKDDDAGTAAPESPPAGTDQAAAAPEEEPTGSIEAGKKQTSNVVPLSRFRLPADDVDSLLSAEPPLDFRDLRRPPFTTVSSGLSSEFAHPVNDNRSAGHHPGGGGGGGGGGGDGSTEQSTGPRKPGHGSSTTGDPPQPRTGDPGNSPPPGPAPGPGPDPHRNRAPRVESAVQLRDVIGSQLYFIPVLALLAGASDADGDTLSAINVSSSSGTLTPVDGGWTYVPGFGRLDEVTLTYSISDGTDSVQQVAHFSFVEAPPIIGTPQDDNLLDNFLATSFDDRIDAKTGDGNMDAGAGDQVVIGGDGLGSDDLLVGGSGADLLRGGTGDDTELGETGNDVLDGDGGDDKPDGGDGDDVLVGGDGDDSLDGGSGNDTLDGGAGNDVLQGGAGEDAMAGSDGGDALAGNDGNDLLDGGAGNDVLADGNGADVVHGGGGNDLIVAAADASNDVYDGGVGDDVLDYSATTSGVVIDVDKGIAGGEEIGSDQISGIEIIIGGQGNDLLKCGHGLISMTGGDGDDTFAFEAFGQNHHGQTVHTITDFTVGDKLLVTNYVIYEHLGHENLGHENLGHESGHGNGVNEDPFHDQYFSDGDHHRTIRFRFEKRQGNGNGNSDGDGDDMTVVTVSDGSPDNEYEIQLFGHHLLVIQDNV